ncbi:hypothetical protein [Planomicrobium okeanokoites]|uniref:hypothetical protein n=1 Tax=Planomicrobium okeanokoites TaxID=244 RepID=UPI002490D52E|nr:hypothetical protein [Planomicrobium okeanokoites]
MSDHRSPESDHRKYNWPFLSLFAREKHPISGFEVRETYEMTYFSRNRVKSWFRSKKTPKPNPNPKPKGMRQTRACLLK